jgi:GNAT superfamily N-acetyltransferase
VRSASADDRDASIRLVQRAFDEETFAVDAERLWNWLFQEHPLGASPFVVADAGDRLAGQYATVPARLQHAGRVVRGLISVQTATDPDFQRQGVLSALATALYEQTRESFPVVFGFPNQAVAPARYSRLDWVELRPFPLLARPVPRVGAHRPRRTEVCTFDAFGAWADALWSDVAPALGTAVIRDSEYLNWRFCASPYPYVRLGVVRDGELAAFAVVGFGHARGKRIAYVMELLARPDDGAAASALVAKCIETAREHGVRAVATIATSRHPHRGAFLRSGLLPVPARLGRSFSFGVRHNGPGVVPNELFHMDDWSIAPADLDFV